MVHDGQDQEVQARLMQCGPLSGFLYFVKVNVALANRGLAQVDVPPECSQASERIVASLQYTGKFDQPPVGPTLFLRAKQPWPGGTMSAGSWRPVRCPQAADPRQLNPCCRPLPWLPPGLCEVCPLPSDWLVPHPTFGL